MPLTIHLYIYTYTYAHVNGKMYMFMSNIYTHIFSDILSLHRIILTIKDSVMSTLYFVYIFAWVNDAATDVVSLSI